MRKLLTFLLTIFSGLGLIPSLAPTFAPASAWAAASQTSPAHEAQEPTTPPVVVSYFPVFPFGAGENTTPGYVPVVASEPLEANHHGVTRAVLLIHDGNRDVQHDLALLKTLAGSENSHTFMILPQFMLESDIALYADRLPNKGNMFSRWHDEGWAAGGDSTAELPQHPVSSFTVVDLLLLFLADPQSFPDLRQITMVGLGVGGNFVQRYAAIGRAPDLLDQKNVPLRFVVADASSYLYLTASRLRGPNQGFTPPDAESCPIFNSWPHGLEYLNSYGRFVGANSAKMHFASRKITYLMSDPALAYSGPVENNCAALLEGRDYSDRAQTYHLYLKSIYSDTIDDTQSFVLVPRTDYNLANLLGSECGMTILFGDGKCESYGFTPVRNLQ